MIIVNYRANASRARDMAEVVTFMTFLGWIADIVA